MKTPLQDLLKQIAPLPFATNFSEIITQDGSTFARISGDTRAEALATAAYLVHCANEMPKLIGLMEDVRLFLQNMEAEDRPHGGRNTAYPDGCECAQCETFDQIEYQLKMIASALKQASEVEV